MWADLRQLSFHGCSKGKHCVIPKPRTVFVLHDTSSHVHTFRLEVLKQHRKGKGAFLLVHGNSRASTWSPVSCVGAFSSVWFCVSLWVYLCIYSYCTRQFGGLKHSILISHPCKKHFQIVGLPCYPDIDQKCYLGCEMLPVFGPTNSIFFSSN